MTVRSLYVLCEVSNLKSGSPSPQREGSFPCSEWRSNLTGVSYQGDLGDEKESEADDV